MNRSGATLASIFAFVSLVSLVSVSLGAAGCSRDKPPAPANAPADAATPLAEADAAPAPLATAIPAASVQAWVNPAKLPAYDGPTGSVEGTISITGDPSPDVPDSDRAKCPTADAIYGKLFREGAATGPGARALADALVAVTGYSGYYIPERRTSRELTIAPCGFAARVVDLTVGEQLDIVNDTTDVWAPALEQAETPALMLAPPHGGRVTLIPPHPGHFTMVDRLSHPWARADVWAFLHPLHTVSGLDGHYRIDGVPVGKLDVNVRLSAIGKETSAKVDVLANVVQRVDLTLHYAAPKDAGAPPLVPPARLKGAGAPKRPVEIIH